jgi:hypothetical protein
VVESYFPCEPARTAPQVDEVALEAERMSQEGAQVTLLCAYSVTRVTRKGGRICGKRLFSFSTTDGERLLADERGLTLGPAGTAQSKSPGFRHFAPAGADVRSLRVSFRGRELLPV